MSEEKIQFSDFAKVQLKVGKILKVEDHPNADKLYVLTVDLGEEEPRTICAGIKAFYSPNDLLNKKAIFVANLAPRPLRGVESNGMILAASNEDKSQVKILSVDGDLGPGSLIS